MSKKHRKKTFPLQKELSALLVVAACLGVVFCIRGLFFAPQDSVQPRQSETETVTVPESVVETTAQTTTASQTDASVALPDERIIYLTFDDGPTDNTTRILDALDDAGVKATFFVIHTYDGCEEQIRQIHTRGHRVALHSYSHRYDIYRSKETYFDDLQKISDLVYNATGERSKLLRFPGGSSNTVSKKYKQGIMTELTKAVTEKGYTYFDWDWDSMDAASTGKDAASITRYAVRPIGKDNRVILLMHDSSTKQATVEALPEIVRTYKEAGYRFDVLSETSYCYHHTVNN